MSFVVVSGWSATMKDLLLLAGVGYIAYNVYKDKKKK
jgi:uncharacterized membrane protein YebE (DUF533 family)